MQKTYGFKGEKGLYRLEAYYKQGATESEKEVLRFLINRTGEAIETDIHTMAPKCFCSLATIVRICKKNGFLGLKELKQALQNDINFSRQLMQVTLAAPSDEKLQTIVASFLVAKDFQQKFERVNKRTFLYEDIHLQLVSSTNLEPGDTAIIVSYSGMTKEIIEIARNIKLCGGKIIAITRYGTN